MKLHILAEFAARVTTVPGGGSGADYDACISIYSVCIKDPPLNGFTSYFFNEDDAKAFAEDMREGGPFGKGRHGRTIVMGNHTLWCEYHPSHRGALR